MIAPLFSLVVAQLDDAHTTTRQYEGPLEVRVDAEESAEPPLPKAVFGRPSPRAHAPTPSKHDRIPRWERRGRAYIGLAAMFGTAGLALATFRGVLYRCPDGDWNNYEQCRDIGIDIGLLAPLQMPPPPPLIAFAGAAAGAFARRANHSYRTRTGFVIGGAVSATFGFALGALGYSLAYLNDHVEIEDFQAQGYAAVAVAEIGAGLGVTGVVLMARAVFQGRERRKRASLMFAPMRAGAGASVSGRF